MAASLQLEREQEQVKERIVKRAQVSKVCIVGGV
jgi:hypothetical protein